MKKLSDFQGQKIAVNCTTLEQAKAFCKLMHESGLKWCTGESYLKLTNWEGYKENTCYAINDGEYCSIDFYEEQGYTILPATDFLEEEFVYGQEYEFSMDSTVWVKRQFLCKTPNNRFVAWNDDDEAHGAWKYCRKINTERLEAITTAKELITKFDIKQEELFNK